MRFYQFGTTLPSSSTVKKVRKELEERGEQLLSEFKRAIQALFVVWETCESEIQAIQQEQKAEGCL